MVAGPNKRTVSAAEQQLQLFIFSAKSQTQGLVSVLQHPAT